MLSDKQLSEIREREQKATVGPWNRWPLRPTEMVGVDATDCRVYMAKFNKECLKATHNRQVRDADFIAHSRTDIPLLLDEVSELRKIARELATELAYVHESPTFEMCKSATGSELLSRPSIQQLTSEKRGNEARIKGAEDWVASCERQLAEAKLKLVAARKDK